MKYSPGSHEESPQNGPFMEAAGIEPAKDSPGFVYVVLHEKSGLLKIGTTRDLATRLRQLRHTHGDVLLLTWIDGDREEEHSLHERYDADRVEGEWFDSDQLLLDALDGRLLNAGRPDGRGHRPPMRGTGSFACS